MTAAAQDRNTERKDGVVIPAPVVADDCIYGGTLTAVNAAGYLNPGSDTAGLIFHGIAEERADNTGGAAGDINCLVRRRGLFLFDLGTAITIANVGDEVFLVDDQSVDLTANVTNKIFCGIIAAYYSTTKAWIDIEPAIRQADVATHIADTSGAHAASAVSIADAGTFTAQTEVEAALQEIYQDLLSIQQFIPVPLTALFETDATNTVAALGPSTTPTLDMANGDTDSGLLVTWAAGNSDPVIFQMPLPPDLKVTADLVLHLRAKMGGSTDTPVISADTYFNEGDTKVSDDSAALSAAYAEKTITIAAADIPAGAQTVTIELTPGTHATDSAIVSAMWLEYARSLLTS